MKRSARLVPCALALFAVACAPPAVSLRQGPRPFTETDYEDIYRRWTRSENDFAWSRMADVLRVSATFESWEFRWAYVVRYTHDYSMDTSERDAMLRATLADAQQHHRFFVTLAGESVRESDLTGRLSAWRVLLVDEDGHVTEPVEIERIRRPSAVEVVYFPSVNPHRNSFRIVFPARRDDGSRSIPEGARRVRLRFTGPRGQVDLVWELAEPYAIEETAEQSSGGETTEGQGVDPATAGDPQVPPDAP